MPLKLYKRKASPTWHYRGTVQGKRLRGSTGTTDKAEAERFRAKLEHREWQRGADGIDAGLKFAEAVMMYLDTGKEHFGMDRLVKFWGETLVKDIRPSMIRDSAPKILPKGSPATWNRAVITPTAAIINYAAGKEICHKIQVPRFRIEKPSKVPATWEWVETFMSVATPQLGALAAFMFLTGARIGECIALTWNEVSLPQAIVSIRSGKTKTSRRAHLPAVLLAALANLPKAGDRVFGYKTPATARFAWERTVRKAGLRLLLPHACRHGFATALLHAGVDVITIAKLGGWSSPQHVFQTYGHASDDATLTDRIVGRTDAKATPTEPKPLVKKA